MEWSDTEPGVAELTLSLPLQRGAETLLDAVQTAVLIETLDALGVSDPDFDALCASALKDPTAACNPVALTPENILPLYKSCFAS